MTTRVLAATLVKTAENSLREKTIERIIIAGSTPETGPTAVTNATGSVQTAARPFTIGKNTDEGEEIEGGKECKEISDEITECEVETVKRRRTASFSSY